MDCDAHHLRRGESQRDALSTRPTPGRVVIFRLSAAPLMTDQKSNRRTICRCAMVARPRVGAWRLIPANRSNRRVGFATGGPSDNLDRSASRFLFVQVVCLLCAGYFNNLDA